MTIHPDIAASIDETYPDDQATGFAEGDLRGWMWVEAPPGGEVAEEETAEGATDEAAPKARPATPKAPISPGSGGTTIGFPTRAAMAMGTARL